MENQFKNYEGIKSILITGNLERKIPNYCFLIPTYKRPLQLKRALSSIFMQANAPEYNIVVVDNDNTPGSETEEYLRELGKEKENLYYYKNEENIGLFGNWNRCYELALGEYCCILMDDDEVRPQYLNRIDSILRTNDFDCIRVGSQILDKNDEKISEKNYLERRYLNRFGHLEYITWRYFLFRSALPPSGMCIKKNIILDLGGYDEQYWPGSDFEMDMRLVKEYKVVLLWERLCITHTEVSSSKTEIAIKKSIPQGLILLKRAYNDIYHKNGKYDWIAEVRTWIGIEKSGYKVEDLEDMQLDIRYNSKYYKNIYRILYRIHRIIQTFS